MAGGPASSFPYDEPAGAKVLVAEDKIFIALDLEAQTVEMGHDVVGIAATASAAIEKSREIRPGIAIVDLQLADGSRGQDAALVLGEETQVPTVLVSGSRHQVTAAEGSAFGPLAMLPKPLLPDELRRAHETKSRLARREVGAAVPPRIDD
jgi:AmiR/NasT family two-component response regulator